MRSPAIPITGDPEADLLLEDEPLALVLGMLLDQQVPMEWAFRGPATLRERLGGDLDAAAIASMDRDSFVELCSATPAVHRFPSSMGDRIQALCAVVVQDYDGRAERIWTEAADAADLARRVRALPGYGAEKTRILVAILAKRLGVTPAGWERVAAPFSDDQPRSAADVDSPEALQAVRAWKKAAKAAGRSKSG